MRFFAIPRVIRRAPLALPLAAVLALSGCAGKALPKDAYGGYTCEQLLKAMEYRVESARRLNPNDIGTDVALGVGGGLASGAGLGMLALGPVGWGVAGVLLMVGGEVAMEELDKSEKKRIQYKETKERYDKMREQALNKKCDYYAIPEWDAAPN